MNVCRLIGFASPVPTTLTEQIGKDEVARFGDMSALHADGWGTAWLRPEAAHPQRLQLQGYRGVERAPRDPRFAELADRTPTVAQLVHLRWATGGARGVVGEHPSVLAGRNHAGAQRVHFATTDAGLAAFPGCESVAARDHGQ